MSKITPPDFVVVASYWRFARRRRESSHPTGTVIQVELHHIPISVSHKGDVIRVDRAVVQADRVPGTRGDNLEIISTSSRYRIVQQIFAMALHTQCGFWIGVIPTLEVAYSCEIVVGIPGMDNVGEWHQHQPGIHAMVVGVKANINHLVIFRRR